MSEKNGIVSVLSSHSFDETVSRLQNLLQQNNITLFALIDHSGEAEKVGLKMIPTRLFIFGNPKTGTPLMQSAPSTAIDLPLKLLVSQDPERKVWITYNEPEYLQQRHGFPTTLIQNISAVEKLARKAAEA
jgi:uncharacterized protein (DUF302 family)